MSTSAPILILDFGSQYTQLIARRLREMGAYTEIHPCNYPYNKDVAPKGIILSGGPQSLEEAALPFDPLWLEHSYPVLGICYGMQLLTHLGGGAVRTLPSGEYGKQQISVDSSSALFRALPTSQAVWMSHRDSVHQMADTFACVAKSADGHVAAIAHKDKPHFGLQFHPEVTHTEQGGEILQNFLDLCGCSGEWTMEHYMEQELEEIRNKVGDGVIFSLVSGGVDSTVATALCVRAVGAERVHALYVDTGLMRKDETKEVKRMFAGQGLKKLTVADCSAEFLAALKGVAAPEEKRKIIGELFIQILEREMDKFALDTEATFFCQGTLYTDLIESGKGCGNQAAVIKSHHNVNPPLVEKKRAQGLIVEPNREIFKDEVRKMGELLALPREMIARHPFPGPGLAIRILGEVTEERLEALREADAIYLDEIRKAGLYDEIWQAFAVLLPVKAVGVQGDARTEGEVIGLRAVTSSDGMTAETYNFDGELLSKIATRIVNSVAGVNRVVYDVTSKPPATIEWE